MNGRHAVSWGIQSRVTPDQIVSHALYQPDGKWHYRENGVTYKREGIEKRFFNFSRRAHEASVALDGGIIVLQVYRCKGRRKRAPEVSGFRGQDDYGITSPTGGLIDSPQDLTYYDWVLADPVDSPYATFRFFYRTWSHLRELNLVPESYCDSLMLAAQETDTGVSENHKRFSRLTTSEMACFSFGPDDSGTDQHRKEQPGSAKIAFFLAAPPELAPPSKSAHKLPQPSKAARDIRRDSDPRNLPIIPDVEQPVRKQSLETMRAPSVTPSLLPFVEDYSIAEEIEVGVARQVILPLASPKLCGRNASARPLPEPPLVSQVLSDHNTTLSSSTRI
ncbi:hypothetical protein C8035_v009153 [Colletotrichum spinosum]|uniref:Uncharacterized protein n=1 Tax=Colletotrichum spinosum TaxID=1347390 RepID=A0A4R8Q4Q5_9PEZI|nr:hypothetical protein C8035_v009153 [Colletotrichum spinosum]